MVNVKKTVILSLFLCIALVTHFIESQLPPILPVPGIKMGLANCITLIVYLIYGRKEAALVLFLRILIASLFFGSGMQFIYSLSGGILSFIVILLLYKFKDSIWVLSALSAVSHNLGQIIAAVFITKIKYLWWYLFPLTFFGILSGVFTGIIAGIIVKNKYIRKLFK